MIHLRIFDTTTEYNLAKNNLVLPNVSVCKDDLLKPYYNPYVNPYVDPYVDPYNGHDFVEIGGIKWATMNVGANSITDYGLYFQWGDTQGYTAAQVGSDSGQKYFGWSDYKYSNNGGSNASDMTKYNSTDGKTELEASDDAVTAAWGGKWRMPTTAEFQALGNAVNTDWVTNYQDSGVNGRLMTDKKDSSKVLFFPACGNVNNGQMTYIGANGIYWTKTLYNVNVSNSVSNGYRMNFSAASISWQSNIGRRYGLSVRGVVGE